MATPTTSFEVAVAKEDFKFHAAHFVAFEGYRERLHGHNYKVGVRVYGSRKISNDGYVVDFGNIKTVTRKVCKELNEHFLCPMLSDVIEITISDPPGEEKETISLKCQDGSIFVFPKEDCSLLPIVHATAEELAIYLWSRILNGLNAQWLLERGVHTLEVKVAEAIGQEAVFRFEIPVEELNTGALDVRSFIKAGEVKAMPCPSAPKDSSKEDSTGCQGQCTACINALSEKLTALAASLNANKEELRNVQITANDLERMLESRE